MNEQYKLLAEQAGLKVESWMTNPPKPFQILGSTEQFEKFAELILRECMELAMTEKSRYANLYNKEADPNKYLTMLHCATSMDNYRLLLKEHFGVQE
jgi:hypothetical protein